MEYLDPVANLLSSSVLTAPDPATTGTSLVIQSADQADFPDPATAGEYNLVIYPSGYEPTRENAEIVRVTAKSSNTLTIVREQENTSARTIIAGDAVDMNITAKMLQDIDAELNTIAGSVPTTFDNLSDGTTNKAFTDTEKTKLSNIDDNANDYSHPNHSGDVTSVGDGATTIANNAVTTDKISNANVTYAKIQNVSAQHKVLGRKSASAGSAEELDIDTDLSSVSANDDTVPSAKSTKAYADSKLAKTTDVTSINDTSIADNQVAMFNKTSKDIRTSGKVFSADGTLAGNSDSNVPTEKAVKTYADATKFNYREAWATSTAYALKDVVDNGGNLYICILAHTSGSAADEPGVGVDWEDYWKSVMASVPPGAITMFGGSSAPTGYLLCDGSAVSRSTYSDLFTTISTTYGSGDGSTTFNVPDLRGNVPVGYKSTDTDFDALGETGGAKTVTLTSAQSGVPAHTHSVSSSGAHTHTTGNQSASHSHAYANTLYGGTVSGSGAYLNLQTGGSEGWRHAANNFSTGNQSASHTHSISSSGAHTHTTSDNTTANASEAHSNLQPYITLNFIIKT
jgi:microcystin-dependent protein